MELDLQERVIAHLLKNVDITLSICHHLKADHIEDATLKLIYKTLVKICQVCGKTPTEREFASILQKATSKKPATIRREIIQKARELYAIDTSNATYMEAVEYLIRQDMGNLANLINKEDMEPGKLVETVKERVQCLEPFLEISENQIVFPMKDAYIDKQDAEAETRNETLYSLDYLSWPIL